MHCAVAITSLGSSSSQHSSRIAVLSSEGDLLIVDIEAATGRGGGSVTYVWTIMAHIPVRERPIPSPFICHLNFFYCLQYLCILFDSILLNPMFITGSNRQLGSPVPLHCPLKQHPQASSLERIDSGYLQQPPAEEHRKHG
jgi:hypothetical protein